jgi:ribosome maturation factor RimP
MAELNQRANIEERVRELAEPLVAAEQLELLDVEYVKEQGGWVLRLVIDQPGGQVGVEECQAASRVVDAALDVENVIDSEYSLEVSSPGLNRPLKKKAHFDRVVGQKVRVKTFGPVGDPPRKAFLGPLLAVTDDGITVEVAGAGTFTLPFKDLSRANLEFEFEGQPKPKGSPKKKK